LEYLSHSVEETEAIGEAAANMLIELIEKPKTTIIEQTVIGGEVYEGKTVRKLEEKSC